MKYNIPFIKPNFPAVNELANEYTSIIKSNWYTNFGPYEKKFRQAIEEYIDHNGIISVTFANATIALIAAIVSILGKGDGSKKIIMPSFTFVAGAQAILWGGYRPIFVDINPDDLQANINLAQKILSVDDDIVAILFCNSFGIGSKDIIKWESMARKHSIPLIIDSAAGFGSKYSTGEALGSKGNCEIFSFHATKPFAIGEGGAVTTKDSNLAKKLHEFTNFGFNDVGNSTQLSMNAKMQELNAVIGLLQFKHFESRLKNRRLAYKNYWRHLEGVGFKSVDNIENSSLCFATLICPPAIDNLQLIKHLQSLGIQARKYYNLPIHKQAYFENGLELYNTEIVANSVISLPIHDDEYEYTDIICREIILFIESKIK